MSHWMLLAAAEAPPAGAGGGLLDGIVNSFGLSWQMFLSQLIAFLIVAWVLKRFAYGPVLHMLEERKQRIAESLANAEKIKAELAQTEALRQGVLTQANTQANKLIEEARAAAEKERVRLTQEAVATVNQMVENARQANEAELARLRTELRQEIGRLVVETTARVTGKILTLDDQRRLAEETSKELAA